jgi:hypothetical protein
VKYFCLLLMLVSINTLGCGEEKSEAEKDAFVTVRKVGNASVVSIYFPSAVEGAKYVGASVLYEKDGRSIFSIPVATHDPTGYETSEAYKGMVATNISGENSELSKFSLFVNYRYPVKENGGMIMCGPEREYKIGELIHGKL